MITVARMALKSTKPSQHNVGGCLAGPCTQTFILLSRYYSPSTVSCVHHAQSVHMPETSTQRNNSQRTTDVMHCGALPNRSAATRYDFEDTPRATLHIYVGKTQKTSTRSMLREQQLYCACTLITFVSHPSLPLTPFSHLQVHSRGCAGHSSRRQCDKAPAAPACRVTRARPRCSTITLHEKSFTPGIAISWSILRGV